jgi:DNA primase
LSQGLDIDLSVITLPDSAKDPDELIKKDKSLWEQAVVGGQPAVQWLIDYYSKRFDTDTADGKKRLTTEAMKTISKLSDPVETEHYLKELSKLTDTDMSTLRDKMKSHSGSTVDQQPLKRVKVEKTNSVRRHTENVLTEQILAIALSQKSLRSILNNLPNEYLTEPLAKVKYYLLDEKSVEIDGSLADKLAELELMGSRLVGDKRPLMLTYLRELELLEIEKRRAKLLAEFSTTDDDDEKKREIINGAIRGLNQSVKLLRVTGQNDEFAGLFQVWDSRKDQSVV